MIRYVEAPHCFFLEGFLCQSESFQDFAKIRSIFTSDWKQKKNPNNFPSYFMNAFISVFHGQKRERHYSLIIKKTKKYTSLVEKVLKMISLL